MSLRRHSPRVDVTVLLLFSGWAAFLGLSVYVAQQRGQIRMLEAQSTTDPLTGLMNRRGFDERLHAAFSHAVREREPLSLVVLDLDRFKEVNDLHGHDAGDQVLSAFARCLKIACYRPSDVTARIGGDEFAIILPGTNEVGAQVVVDRLQMSLRGLSGTTAFISASAGISSLRLPGRATFDPTLLGLLETDLKRRADEAMYADKRTRAVPTPSP